MPTTYGVLIEGGFLGVSNDWETYHEADLEKLKCIKDKENGHPDPCLEAENTSFEVSWVVTWVGYGLRMANFP